MPPKKASKAEQDFLTIATGITSEHVQYHLSRHNNDVQLALNEHFESRCGKFKKEKIVETGRRGRETQAVAVSDSSDDDNNHQLPQTMMMMAAPANDGSNKNQKKNKPEAAKSSDAAVSVSSRGRATATVNRGGGAVAAAVTQRGRGLGRGAKQQVSSSSDESSSSSSSDNEETVPTTRGRGGRGRGRGRAAAAAAAAASSSSSSSSEEDSDDDGDDDCSGNQEDAAPRGRGRGRGGRGRVAAAGARGRGKGKKNDDSEDDDDSSSEDSDDEDNDEDDAPVRVSGGGGGVYKRLKVPLGKMTPQLNKFAAQLSVPFMTAAEAERRYQRFRNARHTIISEEHGWNRQRGTYERVTVEKEVLLKTVLWDNIPRHFRNWLSTTLITSTVVKETTTRPFAKLIDFLPPHTCNCMFKYSEHSSLSTRRILLHNALANRELQLYTGQYNAVECLTLNATKKVYDILPSYYYGDETKRQAFTEKFGTVLPLPACYTPLIYTTGARCDTPRVAIIKAGKKIDKFKRAKAFIPLAHRTLNFHWISDLNFRLSRNTVVMTTSKFSEPAADDCCFHVLHLLLRALRRDADPDLGTPVVAPKPKPKPKPKKNKKKPAAKNGKKNKKKRQNDDDDDDEDEDEDEDDDDDFDAALALAAAREELDDEQDDGSHEAARNPDFKNFAGLNYRTIGSTRAEIWARRSCAEIIAQLYKIPTSFPNELTLDNLLTTVNSQAHIFKFVRDVQKKTAKEIFDTYDEFFTRANIDYANIPLRPPGVTVDLYPHQRRTVAFILDRERNGIPNLLTPTPPIALPPHPNNPRGYTHYRFWVNSALGAVVAAACGSPEEAEIMSGGKHRGVCVADSVGLGKTLSVISAIILNPCTDRNLPAVVESDSPVRSSVECAFEENTAIPVTPERALFAANLKKKLKIKASLVIVPLTLVGQWEAELVKRAPTLVVLRYHGTDRKKYTYADFAAADIIITTFETYRAQLSQEFFWLKYEFMNNHPLGLGHIAHRHSADNLGFGLERYHDHSDFVKKYAAAAKTHRKRILAGGPETQHEVLLSRLVFHRCICDEFHKSSGVNSDFPLVESTYLILVSGTPLDADFSSVMKRMGILDYSFVSEKDVEFVTSVSENAPPGLLAGEILQEAMRANNYSIYRDLKLLIPNALCGENYAAPAQVCSNFARFAVLSQLMIRNSIDTCPELANVRVTERVEILKHTEAESQKYYESLEAVRNRIKALQVRGRLSTHIMAVLRLLNDLRRAAVDPFNVTIAVQDALAVGSGTQFDNENARNNIHLVPVNAFCHLIFPQDFANDSKIALNELKRLYPHVQKVPAIDALKENLVDLVKKPPVLFTCPICIDDVQQPTFFKCGHSCCRECLLALVQRNSGSNDCPICRTKDAVAPDSKKTLLTFPQIEAKENKEEDADAELAATPPPLKKGKKGGAAAPAAAGGGASSTTPNLPTKVLRVVEIVNEETRKDPTAKFLVFTTFASVINTLRHELALQSHGCVTVDASSTLNQRASRIESFQSPTNSTVRVCIVSSRVGNMGLTLTAANHLIIVEPSANLDVDTQILGRVKRLGQTRPVTVHRLHVANTIEIPLYELVQARTVSLSAGGSEAAKQTVADTITKLISPTGHGGAAPQYGGAQRPLGMMMMGNGNENPARNDDDDDDSDDQSD